MKAVNSAQSSWIFGVGKSQMGQSAASADWRRTLRMARAIGSALRPHLEQMEGRVLLSSSVYQGYTLNTIGYFGANDSGGNPRSALIADAQGNLYGTASAGGQYGAGAVFEIANDGLNKITTLVSFDGIHGRLPYAGLTMDANGDLFGTTYQGGTKDDGTVFEIAKGSYPALTTLASFTGTTNLTTGSIGNGAHPVAGVTLDSAGNLFGTADDGGDKGFGSVWEIASGSNTITVLASFTGGTEAARPNGNVTFDGAGNLLGTTYLGGANGDGTVFELAAGSSTITTLASFSGTDGKTPDAGLTPDGSGNLYGTTFGGGANNHGTVFEVGVGTNTITTLASFNGNDGASPYGGLIVSSSGLYGTTESGGLKPDGTAANGTVFEIAPGSNVITTIATFVGTNGSTPYASLLQDASGNLLGTTYSGGDKGAGTVFEIPSGSNALTTLASFAEVGSSISPATEAVTVDPAGNVYGMTPYGGTFNQGTIYEIAAGRTTFTTLASFDGTNTGAQPDGIMAIDSNGNLFGTASAGGANGVGTVFELPSGSNAITALASFDATNNGASTPNAGVTLSAQGNLYGTTTSGGANNDGTVFELAAGATSIKTLASFDVTKDGANPYSGVIVDDAGNVYGTIVGGPDPAGIVYQVSTGSGAITPYATFSSDNGQYLNGQYPDAGVIRDAGGNLYGTAYMGGTDNLGTVFKVANGSHTATAIASFTTDSNGVSDGQNPHSNLTLDNSGNLWGTTYQGGADGDGTIFEVIGPNSQSATLSTLATFNGSNGANPYAGMAMDASGSFYGTTEFGGVIGGGTVFELSTHSVVTLTPEPTTPNPAQASQALSYIVSLGDAVPDGETVTIEDTSNNNLVVATGTLTNDTAVLTVPSYSFTDGTHNLVAIYAGDANFPPGQSLPYPQVIEGAPTTPALVALPVINGDNPNGLFKAPGQGPTPGVQRSMVEDVVYSFNEPVMIPDANAAFTVAVAGPGGGTVPTTLFASAVAGSNGTKWAVSLTGQAEGTLASIANGEYSITINPASVFALDGKTTMDPGTGETDTFYRLYGDINGDRIVNNADIFQFRKAERTYNPAFDYNADGIINNSDNFQFRKSQTIDFFSDSFVSTI